MNFFNMNPNLKKKKYFFLGGAWGVAGAGPE